MKKESIGYYNWQEISARNLNNKEWKDWEFVCGAGDDGACANVIIRKPKHLLTKRERGLA